MFRHPNAIFRGLHVLVSYSSFVCVSGRCELCFARCSQLLRNAFRSSWHLDAETCRGNLMSTIRNAYNALEYLLVILHRIMKNARHNYQDVEDKLSEINC
jgi:hypothetical protein